MHQSLKVNIDATCLLPPNRSQKAYQNGKTNRGEIELLSHDASKNQMSADAENQFLELEPLGMISKEHIDLFDHPMISSLIWLKWSKVRIFFILFSIIKIFHQIFAISYAVFTFGGAHLPWNNFDNGTCKIIETDSTTSMCQETCCNEKVKGYRILLFFLGLAIRWISES